jgi:hypothetical protein
VANQLVPGLGSCPAGHHSGSNKDEAVESHTIAVSIYAYSRVVRFITDYLIGGYIFTLFDGFYQSTNFFLNLLLYMLTFVL